MSAFEYQALDAAGKSRKGVLQADTPRQVRQRLREKGLVPVDVQAVETESGRGGGGLAGLGRERALLLRQLTTLLRAGLPLEESLAALVDQSERPAIRRRLGAIRARVVEGQSLSAAMAEHGRLFPPLYTSAISAGERAGRLESVLEQLCDFAEKREALGRNLGMALVYPVLLTAVALAVVWGLLGFVVPRVIGVFDTVGETLPAVTRSLLAIADFMDRFGLYLGLALVAVGVLVFLAFRLPAWRPRTDRFLLRLPGAGRLIRAQQTARFTRTLAILVASAVPLVEALRVAGRVVGNAEVRADIQASAGRVREGASLARSLEDARWLSPMARRLIHSGERSGELAELLDHAAAIQEKELEVTMSLFMALLQPILILLVGLLVLYIVLAIMLPILDVSQLVG